MPAAAPHHGRLTKRTGAQAPDWRDPKRHLWLLGTIVPGLVGLSWLGVHLTGDSAFWWCGAVITFMLVPLLDHLVGADTDGLADSALAWLEDDPFIGGRPTSTYRANTCRWCSPAGFGPAAGG